MLSFLIFSFFIIFSTLFYFSFLFLGYYAIYLSFSFFFLSSPTILPLLLSLPLFLKLVDSLPVLCFSPSSYTLFVSSFLALFISLTIYYLLYPTYILIHSYPFCNSYFLIYPFLSSLYSLFSYGFTYFPLSKGFEPLLYV